MIRRIRFSPAQSLQIMVLFNEGDISIYDIDHNIKISDSRYLRAKDLKTVDCDWLSDMAPIIAASDGSLRICDK
jgi:hypothetical protein